MSTKAKPEREGWNESGHEEAGQPVLHTAGPPGALEMPTGLSAELHAVAPTPHTACPSPPGPAPGSLHTSALHCLCCNHPNLCDALQTLSVYSCHRAFALILCFA